MTSLLSAPIKLFGEGSYAVSDVKEMEVTDEYLELDKNIRNCQTDESFESCSTRQYLDTLKSQCNCLPYALRELLKYDLVCLHRLTHLYRYYNLFQLYDFSAHLYC